jgi:superfamily I DNA and RNA helicase
VGLTRGMRLGRTDRDFSRENQQWTMIDVIHGQTKNQHIAQRLGDILQGMDLEGTLYIGYPVLATADEPVAVDALLVTKQHGLVVFSIESDEPGLGGKNGWEELGERMDRLFVAVENSLLRHESLRSGRRLATDIKTVAVFPMQPNSQPSLAETYVTDLGQLTGLIESFEPINASVYVPLQAALQGVSTIKPRKRRESATIAGSRGSILREIEVEIANLDKWQKQAAIENPPGPQRIRGLAGSGKTIVLALKAAYLHAQHPDWNIAVTFQSRSLYQQFEDLIRRFTFEYINDTPDFDRIRILHSWGGRDRDGLYMEVAERAGHTPKDFTYARSRYGRDRAFQGVCQELLSETTEAITPQIYDAVLIDEAQDLPAAFFRLVYRFTKDPKRIIWAYDDLQKLSETSMLSAEDLFGHDESGDPMVRLFNSEGQPHQDIILPRCYRNPHWMLTVAHALGLGIYREEGLVQHFDDPTLWSEIGYELVSGELKAGAEVILRRHPDSYPEYFERLLDAEDAIVTRVFPDEMQQAAWVAKSIAENVSQDQLDLDDVLIILPSALRARQDSVLVIDALSRVGLNTHLVGVTSSADEMFRVNSVAIAHIHRSKGNEAPMVYVLNAQDCFAGHALITLRNTLFTAITRSKAWVRICGCGDAMQGIEQEISKVKSQGYQLRFAIPKEEELKHIRQIHRELTAAERDRIQRAERGLREFVDAVERGDIDFENLPLDLRGRVARYLQSQRALEDDGE